MEHKYASLLKLTYDLPPTIVRWVGLSTSERLYPAFQRFATPESNLVVQRIINDLWNAYDQLPREDILRSALEDLEYLPEANEDDSYMKEFFASIPLGIVVSTLQLFMGRSIENVSLNIVSGPLDYGSGLDVELGKHEYAFQATIIELVGGRSEMTEEFCQVLRAKAKEMGGAYKNAAQVYAAAHNW